jgi:hypothetical protein
MNEENTTVTSFLLEVIPYRAIFTGKTLGGLLP